MSNGICTSTNIKWYIYYVHILISSSIYVHVLISSGICTVEDIKKVNVS